MDNGNSVNSDVKTKKISNIVITDVQSIKTLSGIAPSNRNFGKPNSIEIRKITMPNSFNNVKLDSSTGKPNKFDSDETTLVKNTKESKKGMVSPIVNISISKISNSSQDKVVGSKIKNLNDLKKVTPHVNLPTILSKSYEKKSEKEIVDGIKAKLKKYCRTCAGLKVPLIDIFSERGTQMRLEQQMQHLENIDKNESLSTQMCMDCICDMKMSYKFFMQIKKAELRLKAIYLTLNEVASKSISSENEIEVTKEIANIASVKRHTLELKDRNVVSLKQYPSELKDTNIASLKDGTLELKDVGSKSVEEQTSELKDSDIKSVKVSTSQMKITDITLIEEKILEINDTNDCHEDVTDLKLLNDDHFDDIEPYNRIVSMEELDPAPVSDVPENYSKSTESEILKNSTNNEKTFSENTEGEQEVVEAFKDIESKYIDNALEKNVNTNDPAIIKEGKTKSNNDCTPEKDLEIIETETVKVSTAKYNNSSLQKEFKCKLSANQSKKKINLLKRKSSFSNTSNEDIDNSKKTSHKVNTGLKDIKIPKLNLQDPSSVKIEKDGVMYVTAKGSKPNEMLLIKVKKVDKRGDKVKKKMDAVSKLDDKKDNVKDSIIDKQIEEYKKKRVQILGESASLSEIDKYEPDIRAVSDMKSSIKDEKNERLSDLRKETNKISINLNSLHSIIPSSTSCLQKIKDHVKDFSKKESMNTETDEHARLKSILKQKDEYIYDFVKHLRQRKIVASRLKDDDIITLYEMKNNVVIERSPSIAITVENLEADALDTTVTYECDFCFKTFLDKEMESEHAKIHDFKLMHYCEDCNQEFNTHKAKRGHNIACIQKLMCKYCEKILESKGKKRQHEQKHCDEQYGQLCDMCGEKFKHAGTLDQHVKVKHMDLEKIFKCPQCPKKFAFRAKLTFHLKSVHTMLRAFLCEDCGADFKNPASLRHHRIRKHQNGNNKKECNVCKKMIPIYGMSKHMHTHRAYSIKCSSCEKMFKNTSTLKQHQRIHENKRQYMCDKCGVGFNRRDGLRLHLRVHEKPDNKGLKECSCTLCGQKFPNHSTLVIHRNRVHSDGRNYTCNICNRSMISSRSLEWHMANIHDLVLPESQQEESSLDKETRRVTCTHCNKTFKTEMILRTHVKNTHTEKNPVKCPDCDEAFTSDVRLKHHMMVAHDRIEGTMTCPHCPKRFVNGLRLKTHMISHSDERPFTCDICGFMLKTKVQLVKHKQNKHSDERPLPCRFCAWKCKQVSALVCHERTHTNERPYSCSVCKQKFKYLGDKNKHERRHESLGGAGFKRIVTGRNTTPKFTKKSKDSPSEASSDVPEDYEEQNDDAIETFDESQLVKFEMVTEESQESYEQAYIGDGAHVSDKVLHGEDTHIVIGMDEETAVYTEEVTADQEETDTMIDPQMLPPGTVVHLQQQDETGKIQVIPVMLSLSDLADSSSDVTLTAASIMYSD